MSEEVYYEPQCDCWKISTHNSYSVYVSHTWNEIYNYRVWNYCPICGKEAHDVNAP